MISGVCERERETSWGAVVVVKEKQNHPPVRVKIPLGLRTPLKLSQGAPAFDFPRFDGRAQTLYAFVGLLEVVGRLESFGGNIEERRGPRHVTAG